MDYLLRPILRHEFTAIPEAIVRFSSEMLMYIGLPFLPRHFGEVLLTRRLPFTDQTLRRHRGEIIVLRRLCTVISSLGEASVNMQVG